MAEMLEDGEFFQRRHDQRPLYHCTRNVMFSPIRVEAWHLNHLPSENARCGSDPSSPPMVTTATSSPITSAARRATVKKNSRSNGWEADLDSQSDYESKLMPSWLSHSVLMDVKDTPLCWCPSWQRGPLLLSNRIGTAPAANASVGRDGSVSGWENVDVSKQGGSCSNSEDDKIVQPSTGRTESVSEFSTKATLPKADDGTLLTNDGFEVLPPSNLGSWAGWSSNKIRLAAIAGESRDGSSCGLDSSSCGSDSSSRVEEADEEDDDDERWVYSSSSNEDGDIIQLEAGVKEKLDCNGDICYTIEEAEVIRRILSRQLNNGVAAFASKLASFTLHDWRQKLCGPIICELETSKSYRASGLDANYRFGREKSVPPLKRFINNHLASEPPALLSEALPANIRRRAFVNTANAMRGTTKDSFLTVHGSGSEFTPRNVDSANGRDISGKYGANLVPDGARFDPSTRYSSAVIKDRLLQSDRRLHYNTANLGTVGHGSGTGDAVSSTDTRRHGREPKASNQTGNSSEANALRVPRAIVKDNGSCKDNGGSRAIGCEEDRSLVSLAPAKNPSHGGSSVGERSKRATSETLDEQSELILEYYTTCHVIPESVGPTLACSITSDSDGDSDAQSEAESDTGEPPVVLPLSRSRNATTLEEKHAAERKMNTFAAGKETNPRRKGGVGERFGGYRRVGDAIRGGSYWRRAARVHGAHSTVAAHISGANSLSACPCRGKEAPISSSPFTAGSAGRVEKSGTTGAGSSHRCQTIAEPKRQDLPNRFAAANAASIPRYTVTRRHDDHGSVGRRTATSASRFPPTISRKPSLRLEAAASPTVWATDKRSVDIKPENTPEVSLAVTSRQGALRHGSSLLPSHTRAQARRIGNEVSKRGTFVSREPREPSHDLSARGGRGEEQGFHHHGRGEPNGVHNDAASSNRTGHALYECVKKMGGVAPLEITPFPVNGSHRRITCGLLW